MLQIVRWGPKSTVQLHSYRRGVSSRMKQQREKRADKTEFELTSIFGMRYENSSSYTEPPGPQLQPRSQTRARLFWRAYRKNSGLPILVRDVPHGASRHGSNGRIGCLWVGSKASGPAMKGNEGDNEISGRMRLSPLRGMWGGWGVNNFPTREIDLTAWALWPDKWVYLGSELELMIEVLFNLMTK